MSADKDNPKPAAAAPPKAPAAPKKEQAPKSVVPYGVPPKITAKDLMKDFANHSAVIRQKKLQELARQNPLVADILKQNAKLK